MQSNAMQSNAMQRNAMQCNAMQCNAIQFSTNTGQQLSEKIQRMSDNEIIILYLLDSIVLSYSAKRLKWNNFKSYLPCTLTICHTTF